MLFDLLFRYKLLIFLLTIGVLIAAAAGSANLQVSTDNRIFYGPANPHYQTYLRFESEFTANDNILFVIAAPYTVREMQFPEAIRWLTGKASGLNHVIRIDSLANYPHPVAVEGTMEVASLLDWGCPDNNGCSEALTEAVSSVHLLNRLVSSDLRATGVLATVSISRGAVGEIEALNREIEQLAAEFSETFPEFEIHFTGGVPMMAAFAQATAADLTILLPAALAAISVLLYFVLGSIPLAGTVVLLGLGSVITTLGFAGWIGHTINNATSIVPLITFTLVVASSMHIAVHYSNNLGSYPDRSSARAQAKASLAASTMPILISAATSAVSLCSLWFVDSPPIRQLGLLSAFGVATGCAFSLLVLPLALSNIRARANTRLSGSVQAAMNTLARRTEAGRGHLWIPVLGLFLGGAGIFNLKVNDDFVKFFAEDVPFRIQTDRATELLAGPNHIELVVRNDNGSVFEPDFLAYVSSLTHEVRKQETVANAHSFSDVIADVAKAFSEELFSPGTSEEELAQLFLIYELSLQIGQTNTDLVNSAQNAARISVLLKETTSSEIQSLERQIQRWHADSSSNYSLTITGENIPVAYLSVMNIKAMVVGILMSLTFTAVVLGLIFRSGRLGLVALLSTVVPVLAGFGIWGWMNTDIGLAATAVIALTIGVVVDDSVHYIYRFLDGRRRLELEPRAAAAYAIHRAGTAIVSTSVVMGCGLSLLLLSSFEVNSSFGAVACLIITTALAFSLFVLPRLTIWAAAVEPKALRELSVEQR